ncbi:MAG: hypothetical protein FWF90_01050 [Promicromonosporaceae bacterium]|nr:hypothetical protein [Promicromonosporaceae bacterium]
MSITSQEPTADNQVPEPESFVEQMIRAAHGEQGAHPCDDPDLTGEDRFDAG